MDLSQGVSRRTLLAAVPAVATGLALGTPGAAVAAPTDPPPFIEPPVRSSSGGILTTRLSVALTELDVPGLGRITTRMYEGAIPGPTLRVRPGDTLTLDQINLLAPNPDQAEQMEHNTPHHFNTFNLHTHGLHVSPEDDADNVFREFTPYDAANGLTSTEYRSVIQIPHDHEGGTFWYHPHVHGASAMQILSGMAGVLIVEGAIDEVAEIAEARDVVMCISELALVNGEVPDLRHEDDLRNATYSYPINGVLNPVIQLRPGEVQRWRLVAACAFTVLPVALEGHALHQIAMDGIAFTAPVETNQVTLAMGNRADVLLKAGAPGTYRLTAGTITLATVVVAGEPMDMSLPSQLPGPIPAIDPAHVVRQRDVTFHSDMDAFPGQAFTSAFRITGDGATPATGDPSNPADPTYGRFDPAYVNHTLKLGDVEQWTIHNDSKDHPNHPFHLHTNHFLVVEVSGTQLDPPVWQDTVSIPQGGSITIRVAFADFTGKAVLHCHHLQHEDQGMMQLIEYVS